MPPRLGQVFNSLSADRKERFIRAILLLVCSLSFTALALLAGIKDITDQTMLFACVGGVVIAAAIVSRYGAKWIMRRLGNSEANSRT
jgi:hypothetical protein